MIYESNDVNILLFILLLCFFPLMALIAIKSISAEAVREMFLSKGRKISLQDEQLLYSYSSLAPSSQAEKAGVQVQTGKVKQISHPASYYASIGFALSLIWAMAILCGFLMVRMYNSPAAKLERQANEIGTTVDYNQLNSEMISKINTMSNMGLVFMEPMPENLMAELNEDGEAEITAANGEVIGYYGEYPEGSSEYYLTTIMAKPVANSDILGFKSGDSYDRCVEVLTDLGFEEYLG